MKWYEHKPEDLEMKDYKNDWLSVVKIQKEIDGDGNFTHRVHTKVSNWLIKENGKANGHESIAEIRVKPKIDWSKPLEVKVWNCEDIIPGSTNGWVDVIETRPINTYNNYGKPYYKSVYYINSNGRTDFFHFYEDGYCRTGKEQKIFGKVRNKKETQIKTDMLKLFDDVSGIRTIKNNIVIEKFEDKVVVKEINLMSYDEIKAKYGENISYGYVRIYPCMYMESKEQLYVHGSNRDCFSIKINNEYSLTEWNAIWSDIKECGSRLSEIIRNNKKSQNGKKEVLYV